MDNILHLALVAFMEQTSYSVNETTGSIDVCVVLEGRLEASLSLSLVTVDMSATGTVSFLAATAIFMVSFCSPRGLQ